MQGRPYSLATTAPEKNFFSKATQNNDRCFSIKPCDINPPNSVTTPPRRGKYGDHPISVEFVINISPFFNVFI